MLEQACRLPFLCTETIMQTGLILERGGSIPLSLSMIIPCKKKVTRRRSRRDPWPVAAMAPGTLKPAAGADEMSSYRDNWFHRLAIQHLSSSIRATTGEKSKGEGYEGMVEAAAVIARRHGAAEQQDKVVEALKKAFPEAITTMLRSLLPQSTFSREFFAIFTTIFFSWLVGPCEVRESDFQGKREKNVVFIPKCRFLEATSCVGMCTNLCKLPSQKFINNSLGMPTNMVPNFEDKSCEIIFGQHPLADDPALKQPCFRTSCIAKQTHGVGCSS